MAVSPPIHPSIHPPNPPPYFFCCTVLHLFLQYISTSNLFIHISKLNKYVSTCHISRIFFILLFYNPKTITQFKDQFLQQSWNRSCWPLCSINPLPPFYSCLFSWTFPKCESWTWNHSSVNPEISEFQTHKNWMLAETVCITKIYLCVIKCERPIFRQLDFRISVSVWNPNAP